MLATQWAKLPDGEALAYDEYNLADPWLSPEAVVLVHGFSKNRRFWYQWIPALARDYRVFVVDQRGHGDSAGALRPDAEIDFRNFADDLADFLDAVDVRAAHFVMAELSTSVAIQLAARHPARVLSLVLPGTGALAGRAAPDGPAPTRVGGDWVQLLRERGSEAWARETNSVRLPKDAPEGLREWYISEQARMAPEVLIKVFQSSPSRSVADLLPQVTVPTLMIGGSEAMHASPEDLHKAAAAIPNCQVRILEGMPFNVMNAAPEACIEVTLDFLAGFSTGASERLNA